MFGRRKVGWLVGRYILMLNVLYVVYFENDEYYHKYPKERLRIHKEWRAKEPTYWMYLKIY